MMGMCVWQGVWPVAPRDMYLNVHWRLQENGTILIVVHSETEGNTPPAEAVRALLPCSKGTCP